MTMDSVTMIQSNMIEIAEYTTGIDVFSCAESACIGKPIEIHENLSNEARFLLITLYPIFLRPA